MNSFSQRNILQKSNFELESLHKIKVNPILSNTTINQFINEVYADKANELVFNNPQRLQALTSFLTQRFFIIERQEVSGEKIQKLSYVPLNTRYNIQMQGSSVFNPQNFNPLKYQLTFFSTKKNIYRIDNTDYVLIIYPVPI